MKIGDIDVQKIPPAQGIQCENGCSGKATAYLNGTPYCDGCLREEQQRKWQEDENFFLNSEGKRVYFEIVRRVS